MNASEVFCPNRACSARGEVGHGNIVIHGKARPRYRCKTCGKTFSAKTGTMFEGLRKPNPLIVIVVTLLAYGCPIQAIVKAFGLDERTVASWRDRAGKHCQQVHEALVQQGQLDLVHVQVDEIRVKGHQMIAWMGLAVMGSTRLWLGGAVSLTRDRGLADRLLSHVRACCQPLRALLVCTDGWAAYPNSIRRAFREKVKRTAGSGRAALVPWPQILIGTVIKRTKKKRVVEVVRRMTQGCQQAATALLRASGGGSDLNTAFIGKQVFQRHPAAHPFTNLGGQVHEPTSPSAISPSSAPPGCGTASRVERRCLSGRRSATASTKTTIRRTITCKFASEIRINPTCRYWCRRCATCGSSSRPSTKAETHAAGHAIGCLSDPGTKWH